MTDQEIVALIKEWAPTVLSAVATMFFGVLNAMAVYMWRQYKTKNKQLVDAVKKMAEDLQSYREGSAADHQKIADQVKAQRAEMHLMKKDIEPVKAGLLQIEGVLKHQGQRLDDYVKTLGTVEGTLKAIFKFIDAPKRATDT
jgi:chromosome segregation ATPase